MRGRAGVKDTYKLPFTSWKSQQSGTKLQVYEGDSLSVTIHTLCVFLGGTFTVRNSNQLV